MDFAFTSTLGAACLMAATLPQAVRVMRTREINSFSFGFLALNAVGIGLLLIRSIELRDVGFIVLNTFTFAFWSVLVGLKSLRPDPAAPTVAAPDLEGKVP